MQNKHDNLDESSGDLNIDSNVKSVTGSNKNNIVKNQISSERRKRINRMKKIIVIVMVILLILPTICCIILGFQVGRLQRQVNELAALHNQYEISDAGHNNYAYASTKEDSRGENSLLTVTPAAGNTIIFNLNKMDAALTENTSSNRTSQTNQSGNVTQPDQVGQTNKTNQTDQANQVNQTNEPDQADKLTKPDQTTEDDQSTQSNQTTQASQTNQASQVNDNKTMQDNKNSDGIYSGKKVYLTFDDGPSIYSNTILDILSDYNIKATFFVIGKNDNASKKIYKRIVDEGHTLGMHSYSHDYKVIYNSLEDFDKDFTKLWNLLYDTTGYKPTIYRFPGGSDNLVNENGMDDFIHYLNKASIVYFDWNVVNGDATDIDYTKKQLVNNVLNGVASKDTSIVLMHDSQTKKTTVDSLPVLIDALISGGAQILPLDENVAPIQMIKADSIK